jgi:hypothetical protein
VPTFADRGCRVVSAPDPLAINSVFLTGILVTHICVKASITKQQNKTVICGYDSSEYEV